MSRIDHLERDLTAWFSETAAPRTPDYVNDLLALVADTRQRSAWTIPERWIPMSGTTLGRRTLSSVPWLTIAVLTALVLALAAVAAFVGADRTSMPAPLPAPFGVARNGYIASGQDGDIVLLDPVSGTRTTITGGPEDDWVSQFSRDGTRLAFGRSAVSGNGDVSIWVADADGRNQLELATDGLIDAHVVDWSPDGRSLTVNAVVDGGWGIWILPTDGSAGRRLDVGLAAGGQWRPVDGREILFRGGPGSEYGLYAVRPDGTGLRPVTASKWNSEQPSAPAYAWSPDGTQVAYHWQDSDDVQRIYVVLADGGAPRAITPDAASGPVWSPDGSLIAANTYDRIPERMIIVRADGTGRPVFGPAQDGFSTFTWAPDGTRILIQLGSGGTAMLLDPVTGGTVQTSWSAPNADWQRRAP